MSTPSNQPPPSPGPGPNAGTALDDTTGRPARGEEAAPKAARSPWDRPSGSTTNSLPTVAGDDSYPDRKARGPKGSTGRSAGAPPTVTPGSVAAPAPPPAPSTRPPAPSAVDQYAALGLNGPPSAPTTSASGSAVAPAAPTTPAGGGPTVGPAGAPSAAAAPGAGTATATPPGGPPPTARPVRRGRGERTPRRARLQLRHFNVWTVFKFSVVLAVALFFVWMIIVAVLYGVLDHLKVIDKINKTVQTVENNSDTNDAVTPRIIFTSAFLIGLVDIVLFIVLTTIGSVVYNLCADLVGGIEVTLAERD